MTYAPARLLEVRHYLQPITGLSDAELGIVGNELHVGGYHHGWDQRRTSGDYSWSESTRDSSHKTNAARAFDLGMFARLREFSVWLVGQCASGADDTLDIREVIYSPDGRIVKRWDRLGKRTTGDSSHLGHTHISYFADAEGRDKTAVFRRFFEGDDMAIAQEVWLWNLAPKGYNMQDHLLNAERCAVAALALVEKLAADSGLDPDELDAIKAAAQAGAESGVAKSADDLAAAVAEALADQGLTQEQAEAAAERAVRKVLGAVDDAAV